jgi:two-component system, NtrC family, nitrogen regulation sensor histidine kinase NtrY
MKRRSVTIWLLISAVALFLLAIGAEILYFSNIEYKLRTRKFNKKLAEKETIVNDCLNSLKISLDSGEDISTLVKEKTFSVVENQGTILFYLDNRLVYWSDNSFDIPRNWDDSLFSKPLVFIQNGWFLVKSAKGGNGVIVALLRLRNDYGFENDLIQNGFVREFGVPESTGFSVSRNVSDFNIISKEGKRLFSLVFPPGRKGSYLIALPLLLYSCAFLLLLLLIFRLADFLNTKSKNLAGTAISFIILFLIYILVLFTNKPSVFQETELFSPYRFTLNGFLPSLGHLLLLGILTVVFASIFYRFFPLKELSPDRPGKSGVVATLLLIISLVLFGLVNYIFQQLVSGSNISFEPYKVLELSVYSLVGFFSIMLLFLAQILFTLKVLKISHKLGLKTVVISVVAVLLFYVLVHLPFSPKVFFPAGCWIILISTLWLGFRKKMTRLNLSVIFSLLFGLYSLYYLLVISEKKNIENIKVLTVTYSSENDPEAENLLIKIWPVISKDTVLKSLLNTELKLEQNDKISLYLHETYFGGYWGNFKLYTVTCDNNSPLMVGPENQMVESCFDYFNERIKKFGHQLTGTDFYYLQDQGGRSCYVGRLFTARPGNKTNGLFIELQSTADAFEAGYSELLLDKNYRGYSKLRDYSFAKYINGNLVLRTGEFPYDKTDAEYIDKNSDYRIFKSEGYKHVLYKNGNITVIVSKPVLTAFDGLISFAYIFAFILLISNLYFILVRRPDLRTSINFNFRQKLQVAFISILLFSFISIGIVVSFFSIRQYKTKHLENVKEKVNSVYTELDSKLSMERNLTPDWRDDNNASLEELLIRLSNVFNTDINLYDKNGYLIATSRREVFNRDLTSRRMNMVALINLVDLTKSEYIQREKIGSLEYISAYVPFYNSENQLLAYLNLPYFRMQSVLAREISNIVVAIINFIMLLIIIATSIAVIISGRLTSPLRMLSTGLASVVLGRKSEHLSYAGHDEIGDMVKQYNRMVDEIEESANKLTNSEREYAWREMAKQVAHEIKNPLTPMKLNIQQLYKSWLDSAPGFEKKIERFTKNQIEYIENLSTIASAFSSFAKMPAAKPVEVDLLEQIKTTLELFKNADRIAFRVNWPHENKIIVYADKEHLNGIFSNLIKNGIQSIPAGRDGTIKINLEMQGDKVIVSVADNGSGIPDDLKKNLFTPNFTTKSSGMGLGLSIVKRYVESANGRIWFESEISKGTVFYIELPLIYTVEKLG